MKFSISTVILVSLSYSNAFHSSRIAVPRATHLYSSADADDGNLLNGLKAGFNIFRKGITAGDGLKQSLADALAGPDLDLAVANDRIDAYIKSAPVVVFSWTVSVFSTKAKNYLTSIGATFESVELGICDQTFAFFSSTSLKEILYRVIIRTCQFDVRYRSYNNLSVS